MKEEIYVAGVGMTQFGRHIERSLASLVGEALEEALVDAGATRADIGQTFYSGATQAALQKQYAIPGEIVLGKVGINTMPIWNVENACASGTSAFQLAVTTIRSGACDVALAIGGEKMNIEDKRRAIALFEGGWDVLTSEENEKTLLKLGEGIVPPEGSESDRPYSKFMSIYAALCRYWMKEFGTTQRQIAAVCSKSHGHSEHNHKSQYRKTFTIDEVLNAPPITYPITLPMCSPLSDGAAAVIVCNEDGLKKLGIDKKRAIKVAATSIVTGSGRDVHEYDKSVCRRAGIKAYEQAGISPEDVDLAEVHDASSMGEIMASEFLQLVPMGGGGPAAEAGEFTIGGRVPINTSGGLQSKGHPIGATGLGQIYELVSQLRGEAGKRQVEGAKIALQENGGGTIGYEEGVVTVNIFKK